MGITAKEIAKQLGISAAAVSMALNGRPGVSTATRKRVITAAREAGFDFTKLKVPEDPIVRRSGTVVCVIYSKSGAVVSDTPFFSEMTEGVSEECDASGFFLNMKHLYEGDDIAGKLEDWYSAGCVGIILIGTEMTDADYEPFSMSKMPIVLLDTGLSMYDVDCVQINNIQGAMRATEYLISRTHLHPGYLRSAYPIHNFDERSDGFYNALRANGMSTSGTIVHRLTPSVEGAYADMRSMLADGEELAGAYFADNDLIAAGAIRALRDTGHRVPEDICVVGFDNMPIASYMEPSLTTIHVPKQYMGRVAVQRLATRIREKDPKIISPLKIEISTRLIKRKSV